MFRPSNSPGSPPVESRSPSRAPSLAPPRFSTASSVGSVLSFMSDSKYAQSTAAFLPHKPNTDLRASFLPIDQYGAYERLGGPADDDDFLHEPGQRNLEVGGFPWRGLANISMIILLLLAILTLFCGYPIAMHFMIGTPWEGTFFNATGQIPSLSLLPSPIDPVTSPELYTRTGFDGQEYQLIFSDEFETPGRSFYPGDDPF